MTSVVGHIKNVKRALYFFVAAYFVFFAKIMLKRWHPTVVTITGSSGKTTILHLFEAALGDRAVYTHKANSAFGIPFHILGLRRTHFSLLEWPVLFILAPFRAFRAIPKQNIYITEADAERPGEGQFISRVLMPDITIWLSLGESHGAQFDRVNVNNEKIEKVIANEFGYFAGRTKSLLVINGQNQYIVREAGRSRAHIVSLDPMTVKTARVGKQEIVFTTPRGEFSVPELVPLDAGLSVLAVAEVLAHLNLNFDPQFAGFTLPAGRSSVFEGKKNTTIIDSTYNATIDGMMAMLDLFAVYPASGEKWLVLGDMIEQGKSEAAEHALLGKEILACSPARVVLVGPRLCAHTLPVLQEAGYEHAVSVLMPDEAHAFLEANLKGGETILFKGVRYLEAVIERLLAHSADASKLCRREKIWLSRRRKFGV